MHWDLWPVCSTVDGKAAGAKCQHTQNLHRAHWIRFWSAGACSVQIFLLRHTGGQLLDERMWKAKLLDTCIKKCNVHPDLSPRLVLSSEPGNLCNPFNPISYQVYKTVLKRSVHYSEIAKLHSIALASQVSWNCEICIDLLGIREIPIHTPFKLPNPQGSWRTWHPSTRRRPVDMKTKYSSSMSLKLIYCLQAREKCSNAKQSSGDLSSKGSLFMTSVASPWASVMPGGQCQGLGRHPFSVPHRKGRGCYLRFW